MTRASVDLSALEHFWRQWQETLRAVPGLKAEMLEAVGRRVQRELHSAIDRSGIHDPRGRVKSWQNPHVGSGKGYVAVRADAGRVSSGYQDGEKETAIFLLTNALSSGHKARQPTGRAKRYRPNIHGKTQGGRVQGFHFYQDTAKKANQIALEEANAFLQRLEERF